MRVPLGVNIIDFQNKLREILKDILLNLTDDYDNLRILDVEFRPNTSRDENIVFEVTVRREDGIVFRPIIQDAIAADIARIYDDMLDWLIFHNAKQDDISMFQICLDSASRSNCATRPPTRSPTNFPTTRPTKRPTPNPTRRPTRMPTSRPSRRPTPSPTQLPRQSVLAEFFDVSLPVDIDVVAFREKLRIILLGILVDLESEYRELQILAVDFRDRRMLNRIFQYSNFDDRSLQRLPFDATYDVSLVGEDGVDYFRIIQDALLQNKESIKSDILEWIRIQGGFVEEDYVFKICFDSTEGFICVEEDSISEARRPEESISIEFSDVSVPSGVDVLALRDRMRSTLRDLLVDATKEFSDVVEILDVTFRPGSSKSDMIFDITYIGEDDVLLEGIIQQAIQENYLKFLEDLKQWVESQGMDGTLFGITYCYQTDSGVECSTSTNRPSRLPSRQPTRRPTSRPSRRPTQEEEIVPLRFSISGLPTGISVRSVGNFVGNALFDILSEAFANNMQFNIVEVQHSEQRKRILQDSSGTKVDYTLQLSNQSESIVMLFEVIIRRIRGRDHQSTIRSAIRTNLESLAGDIHGWAASVDDVTICLLSNTDSIASSFADCSTYIEPSVEVNVPSLVEFTPPSRSPETMPSIIESYPSASAPVVVYPSGGSPSTDVIYRPLPSANSPIAVDQEPSFNQNTPSVSGPSSAVIYPPTDSPLTGTPYLPSPPANSPVVVNQTPQADQTVTGPIAAYPYPSPSSTEVISVPSSSVSSPVSIDERPIGDQNQSSGSDPSTIIVYPAPSFPSTQSVYVPAPPMNTQVVVEGGPTTYINSPGESKPSSDGSASNPSVIQIPNDREVLSFEFSLTGLPRRIHSVPLQRELKDIVKLLLLRVEDRYSRLDVWDLEYRCHCADYRSQPEQIQRTRSIGGGKKTIAEKEFYDCDLAHKRDLKTTTTENEFYEMVIIFDISIVSRDNQRDFAQIISDTIRRSHDSILDDLRQWTSLQYFEEFILDLCITSKVGSGYVVCSSDGNAIMFDELPTESPTLSPSALTDVVALNTQSDVVILGTPVPIWFIVLFLLLIILCACCLFLCCYVGYRRTQTTNNKIKVHDEKTIVSDESNKSGGSSDSEDESEVNLQQKHRSFLALPPSHQSQYLLQAGSPPPRALPPSTTPQHYYIQQPRHVPELQQQQPVPALPYHTYSHLHQQQPSQKQIQIADSRNSSLLVEHDNQSALIDLSIGDLESQSYADFDSISKPDPSMYSLFSDASYRKSGDKSKSGRNIAVDDESALVDRHSNGRSYANFGSVVKPDPSMHSLLPDEKSHYRSSWKKSKQLKRERDAMPDNEIVHDTSIGDIDDAVFDSISRPDPSMYSLFPDGCAYYRKSRNKARSVTTQKKDLPQVLRIDDGEKLEPPGTAIVLIPDGKEHQSSMNVADTKNQLIAVNSSNGSLANQHYIAGKHYLQNDSVFVMAHKDSDSILASTRSNSSSDKTQRKKLSKQPTKKQTENESTRKVATSTHLSQEDRSIAHINKKKKKKSSKSSRHSMKKLEHRSMHRKSDDNSSQAGLANRALVEKVLQEYDRPRAKSFFH